MASLNKAMFIGNLTRDPETRYLPNGDAVTNASIACNESWKGKDGEKHEHVEYINLVFYKRLAEIAGEHLRKGAPVYVEGKMKTRKWQTKEGQDRYTTEIIVDQMQMIGGKPGGSSESAGKTESSAPAASKPAPAKGGFDDFDDSIPF